MNTEEEISNINQRLADGNVQMLLAEVIHFALLAMKYNSKLTPSDAFEIGCNEWDV